MRVTIFYSWQSALPNNTNRGFIERALNKAVESIKAEAEMVIEPCVERDVQGIPGTPDIAQAIFRKIDECRIFVGDVSIINSTATTDRKSPNPNVLIELGYAAKALTWDYVVCVYNTAFGSVKDLPFDLQTRLMCTYSANEELEKKSEGRDVLASKLKAALLPMLQRITQKVVEDSEVLQRAEAEAKGTIQLSTYNWHLHFMCQGSSGGIASGKPEQALYVQYSFDLKAFNTGLTTLLRFIRVRFMRGGDELLSDLPGENTGKIRAAQLYCPDVTEVELPHRTLVSIRLIGTVKKEDISKVQISDRAVLSGVIADGQSCECQIAMLDFKTNP